MRLRRNADCWLFEKQKSRKKKHNDKQISIREFFNHNVKYLLFSIRAICLKRKTGEKFDIFCYKHTIYVLYSTTTNFIFTYLHASLVRHSERTQELSGKKSEEVSTGKMPVYIASLFTAFKIFKFHNNQRRIENAKKWVLLRIQRVEFRTTLHCVFDVLIGFDTIFQLAFHENSTILCSIQMHKYYIKYSVKSSHSIWISFSIRTTWNSIDLTVEWKYTFFLVSNEMKSA